MTFLSPLFLWALPFVAGPLLIHLINRKPPRRLPFSHIQWLKLAHQSAMPRKKLRERLLLILRTLMVLFIVGFFARPVMHGGGFLVPKGETTTLIVLLDVSASMSARVGGQDALTLAVEQTARVVRRLPPSARIGFISFTDRVEQELAPTDEKSKLNSALENAAVLPRPSDIQPALELAYAMLANQPSKKQTILIVSDQAKNTYRTAVQNAGHLANFSADVGVVAWEVVSRIPNGGVADVQLQATEKGSLKGQWIGVRSGSVSAADWKLTLNGAVVSQGRVDPKIQQGVPLDVELPKGGFYAGRLELTADAMPFDDLYYVAGRLPKGYSVLFVDGESGFAPSDSEVYYARLALESPKDPRVLQLKVIRPEGLGQETLSAYDVMVLANADIKEEAARVIGWVQNGGGLLLTAGSKWPRAPAGPLGLFRTKPIQSGPVKARAPSAHAFLEHVAGLSSFQWNQIEIGQYRPLEPESASAALLSLENDEALLVKKQIGKGNVLCLTTTLDRSWTNLPAKPIFAPLIRELLSTLADPLREQSSLNGVVGQPFRARLAPGVQSVTVISPDGAAGGAQVRDGLMEWPAPQRPGLYQVKTNDRQTDFSFAINIPNVLAEGETERMSVSDLKIIFPRASVEWISPGDRSVDAVVAHLEGRDVTGWIIVLLIVLFALETVLSRPRLIPALAVLLLLAAPLQAGDGNRFAYAQLEHDGAWDPYPFVHEYVLEMINGMTNIPTVEERRVVTLADNSLFEYPFLLIKGNSELSLTSGEKSRLKQYIDGGGFVFLDDTLASANGPFGASVRQLFAELFPDRPFQRLPPDHALFRSFFLLRSVGGRRIAQRQLEGLEVGGHIGGEGRTAVIYCANDLLGTWMKDRMGVYAYSCEPGGEAQRWESFKLTLNIVYFSLTGTYKKDAIHQPFIEKKLGS